MKVNGKEMPLKQTTILTDFLQSLNYQVDKIAVEINGDIVPKSHYNDTFLNEHDTLEIVHFVGGG